MAAFEGKCVVLNAGIKDGKVAVLLKGAFDGPGNPVVPRNFSSATNVTREVLAVALAAVTSDREVHCQIPDATEGWPWRELVQINLLSGKS